MRFSEAWLREWVNPPVSTRDLAGQLTMAGLEVDSVMPAAPAFTGVVVAEILSADRHPDADKLRVCRVAAGEGEPLQVVCGAPNARVGLHVPLAREGARLPGDLRIRRARLRGVESRGMLCSARELGLSEEHAGLMELPADAPVGTDLRRYLDLGDQVLDLDLTPNRGDCLGLAGIAREVGVLNRCPVTAPSAAPVAAAVADRFPVTVEAAADCPRYLGRVIRGLDARAPTPLWMQERLRRSGLRSLGPLVDVTNYLLLEYGQPLHAFDLARLADGIQVRRARAGERLTLLDGREIELDPETLVIADARRVLALAGIMGGADSGVGEETTDVFLECAFFTPAAVAGRARRYGLRTESSHRFERGVDPAIQTVAMERATALLLAIAGGSPGPVIETATPEHLPRRAAVRLRSARIERLLGVDLPGGEVEEILQRLGMEVERDGSQWRVSVPTHRFDIDSEVDLIEELARVYGYDRLPGTRPSGGVAMIPQPEGRVEVGRIRTALVDRGYQEVVTYSFVDPALQARLAPNLDSLSLTNPLSVELAVLRTSLWTGLLKVLIHNQNRQQTRVRIFECGLRFIKQQSEIKQENTISGLAAGGTYPEQWGSPSQAVDFYDVKSDLEALMDLTGRNEGFIFTPAVHPALHPGQTARIHCKGVPVGWLGTLHPELQKELEVAERVVLFELSLDHLQEVRMPAFQELSRFPANRRDLAVVVDEAVSAAAVRECIVRHAPEVLQEVILFDVYRGKGVEAGRRSIAFGLIFQDSSRTLADQDMDAILAGVVAGLEQELGATLRG
ncbi:phenylalanine--tRNA ligase beta subunit [bacterium BMS3Bbin12]|nr:phenylalanine--tRNA ligase beta subunit [bacterium BMS3Bbin12]GBE50944.1 phenylalanine--tRNA ligase beta subunit [bacterium BMS3Bbin13]